jgi:hypothetical protein
MQNPKLEREVKKYLIRRSPLRSEGTHWTVVTSKKKKEKKRKIRTVFQLHMRGIYNTFTNYVQTHFVYDLEIQCVLFPIPVANKIFRYQWL